MQVTRKKGIEDKESNLFSEVVFKYLPYWWLFTGLFVGSLAVAWVYLHWATPVYETTASILIKDEKKGVDDANLMEQLDLFGSKKFVENEIEVIKSRTLMHEVVNSLFLYAPITAKGTFKSISGYVVSPVLVEAQLPDSLTIEKKVFFDYDSARRKVSIDGKAYALGQWIFDGFNTIRFVPNPNYQCPEQKKPLFFSIYSSKMVTDMVLGGLKVSQATKLSSVIDLSLKDAIPTRAEDVLNGLLRDYNKAAVSDKNTQAITTLKFINERLKLVALELDSVETGIQKYKTNEGIVDVSAQGQLYLDNMGANDQRLSAVNVQLAVLDEVQKYVDSKSDQPGIVPSTFGIEDPGLGQLIQSLYELEVRYEGLKKTTAENNPMLVSLKDEIDKIKPSVLENIRNLKKNLDATKADLSGNSTRYASLAQKLPQKERGLLAISRQQSIKNGIYSFLLQKREETALSYNSAVADTRVVDNADTALGPVSPKPMFIYLIAVVFALGAAAGLIALKEVVNQTIMFRSEIEQFTSVPILGEIMQDSAISPLVVAEDKRGVIAEQFRHLRTALAYIGVNGRKKRLLVTSSVSGEGKSFVAANLASSLALTNKKVVLLEMDLRKPTLSAMFGVSRAVGLIDFFIGDKDAENIIKSTSNKNLFIIPSGAIPPNPSELILNGKLEELLKYLEVVFDYIIIDTSPVGPVTDAYIISPMCDATLYVVRHHVTPKLFIRLLDENIATRNMKNCAIIFNGVKNRGLGQYGYGYGYGYGGHYSYEPVETKKKSKSKRLS